MIRSALIGLSLLAATPTLACGGRGHFGGGWGLRIGAPRVYLPAPVVYAPAPVYAAPTYYTQAPAVYVEPGYVGPGYRYNSYGNRYIPGGAYGRGYVPGPGFRGGAPGSRGE